MDVYLVILEDRHANAEVNVFRHLSGALAMFHRIVDAYDYEFDAPDEGTAEWITRAAVSREGDHVRVVKAEVSKRAN